MKYALNEEEINEIIKEGKFDKEKNIDNAILQFSYITDGLLYGIDDLEYDDVITEEFVEYIKNINNKEKVYQEIYNSFWISEEAWEEIDISLHKQYKEYIKKWLKQNTKKNNYGGRK